ncbi:MAG: c-type cytochrome, partial [Planctomycetota bacterium]
TMRNVSVALVLLILASLATSFRATAGGGDGSDPLMGGLMWDKWWVAINAPEPTGDHPLYPDDGPKSGSTTFRCKECHGWDYKGASGAYGKGSSHYTGIAGVFGSTLTPSEMFDLLKNDTLPNGHGFANYGIADNYIEDLVDFLQKLIIDTDVYIDDDKNFLGDPVQGEAYFTAMGVSCFVCHGANGASINFGSPDDPQWVGTIAVENPWEMLHKIRFGNPGDPMPPWLGGGGGDNQGAADIGRYAQLNLPAVPCRADINADGNVDVQDLTEVIVNWGGICQ